MAGLDRAGWGQLGMTAVSPMSDHQKEPVRERIEIRVHGIVQGVGFRPFVYRLARELGAVGWVLNDTQGVLIQVEGRRSMLEEFLRRLTAEPPPLSSIDAVESKPVPCITEESFRVLASPPAGSRQTVVPPDVGTCADCLEEMWDPGDRRYRYPFLNCTNCGPRYSIIEGLPYDRPRTSMKQFEMCPTCAREYRDPGDRRFHAQPIACPTCGPTLTLEEPDRAVLASKGRAIEEATRWLEEGRILALKGIGGFQLLADATNEEAVQRLRVRKQRGRKPFAVMFPSIAAAESAAEVDPLAKSVLESPASPIVLLNGRAGSTTLAPSVAPQNPRVGVMLPYSPLHHLLLREVALPLVATSGNLSDEPICIGNDEARERLRTLADGFVVHDRPIVRPIDDSVTQILRGRLQVLRRARGYAPMAISAGRHLPATLGVGPQLKSTIAVSLGDRVIGSQHLGDLDNAETYAAFRRAVEDLRRFYDWSPELVAHDMHPEYLSTRYALELGLPTVAVQHHYAHVLSCLADAEIEPPVLGVAWDGTGYGTDGTIWGGEFLRVDENDFERVGHLRTFPLAGGDTAVREPRRSAAGLMFELGGERSLEEGGAALAPFDRVEGPVVRTMLRRSLQVVRTSSAGRLFDGVASLLGLIQRSDFEGEAATALEFAAGEIQPSSPEAVPYPYRVTQDDGAFVFDWGPMVEALFAERQHVRRSAARFHVTLAAGIAEIARRIGEPRVVLTGGCFQNRLLTELTLDQLSDAGLEPVWHSRIPPNDGGISVGQVWAAARVKTPTRIATPSSVPE
jgi:hydrogenase maturation protein HypF